MTETNVPDRHGNLSSRARPVPSVVTARTCLHMPNNSRLTSQRELVKQPVAKAVVFLDRDGVIIEDIHFLKSRVEMHILPGAARALRMLQDLFYIIVVTNQSGIARGLLTEDDLLDIHSELVRCLAVEGAVVDALYYCPHLPEATVPAYRAECNCRKPKPGMLLRAKRDWGIDMAHSFIVGDAPRDIEAGLTAGVKGILLGRQESLLSGVAMCTLDLSCASELILAQAQRWFLFPIWRGGAK